MKLCSQCEFIYEDDQELCDMDGAELFYEPTLRTVSQKATVEPAQSKPMAGLLSSLSHSPEAETFTASPTIFGGFAATGSLRVLLIAAVVVLAAIVFVTYSASRRLFSTRAETDTRQSVQPSIPPATKDAASQHKVSSSPTSDQSPSPDQPPHPDSPSSSPSNQSPNDPARPSSSLNIGIDQVASTTGPASARNLRSAHATRKTPNAGDNRLSIPRLPQSNTLPRVPPLRRLPPAKVENKNPNVASVNYKPGSTEKKQSRLSSFLKKTGRILTKPFRD